MTQKNSKYCNVKSINELVTPHTHSERNYDTPHAFVHGLDGNLSDVDDPRDGTRKHSLLDHDDQTVQFRQTVQQRSVQWSRISDGTPGTQTLTITTSSSKQTLSSGVVDPTARQAHGRYARCISNSSTAVEEWIPPLEPRFISFTMARAPKLITFLTSSLTEISCIVWPVKVNGHAPPTFLSRFTVSLSFQYWCSSAYPSACVPYSSSRRICPTCRISCVCRIDWQLIQIRLHVEKYAPDTGHTSAS